MIIFKKIKRLFNIISKYFNKLIKSFLFYGFSIKICSVLISPWILLFLTDISQYNLVNLL